MAKQFQVNTASGGSLLTSLVSYYKFEGAAGSKGTDFYGTNDLTDFGTVADATGKVGQCANFTAASSQRLDAASNSVFDVTTGDISVAFWYKSTDTNAEGAIVNKQLVTGTGGYVLNSSGGGTGKLKVLAEDTVNFQQGFNNAVTTTDGNWHHYVFSRDHTGGTPMGQLILYVDGSLITLTNSGSTGSPGNITSSTQVFRLMGDSRASITYLSGNIDELGVWTKVLNSNEVSDLYNGGSGQTMVDSVANPHLLSSTGAGS